MCLILFSFDLHPEYQYIVAGNRDEFYERPTQPVGFWKAEPLILAGRDLVGGGAWMGVTKTLKFAAITNYRDPAAIKKKCSLPRKSCSEFSGRERISGNLS